MTEVMEAPATERKYTPLTDEQRQAATLRRDATLLEKYGQAEKAKELFAQADAIAPARRTGSNRVDPVTALTQDELNKLYNHFKTTKAGFAKIAEIVSYKKLAAIAAK
jgi:hypothetical protein